MLKSLSCPHECVVFHQINKQKSDDLLYLRVMFYIGNGDSIEIINIIYMLHSYFCVLHTSLLFTSPCPIFAISSLEKLLTISKNVSNLKNSIRKMNKIKQRYKISPGNKFLRMSLKAWDVWSSYCTMELKSDFARLRKVTVFI